MVTYINGGIFFKKDMVKLENMIHNEFKGNSNKYLNDLRLVCEKNRYQVSSSFSSDPDVVLIGDYHPQGIVWFADNIERIILEMVKEKDVILMEGAEGKVIYPLFNIPESPIYNITNFLEKENIGSFFNDSVDLMKKQEIVRRVMQQTYDLGMPYDNERAVNGNQELMAKRDDNFVNGSFGIKNHTGKRYQIVGMTHLLSGNLLSNLQRAGLSYVVVLPKQIPTQNDVNSYISAVQLFTTGSREEKCQAVNILKQFPIRNSINLLHEALKDKSGRVRKYAAQALGLINDPRSIDHLLSVINDGDELTRWTVLRALSRFADKRIEDLTVQYLLNNNRESWVAASILTLEHNKGSINSKIDLGLSSQDPYIKALAIRLLGRLDDVDLDKVYPSLSDKHPSVREEAIHLIFRLDNNRMKQYDFSKEEDKYILNFLLGESANVVKFKEDKDKVKGSLFGAIIGDALGAPVEGMKISEIKDKHGLVKDYIPKGPRHYMPAGSYTDDGELTLELLESILSKNKFDPSDIARRFSQIGREVDDDFERNIGYGFMTLMAFRKLYAGVNWRFTGNDSEGCGAAMRVAAIGALEGNITEHLVTQTMISHQNDLAIASAIAMGYAIHEAYDLSQNFDKKKFIQKMVDYIAPFSQKLSLEVAKISEYIETDPSQVMEMIPLSDPRPRKKGRGALGTVPLALYSFLRTPDNFMETAIVAVNHSGDSDSIASMACAISGAYNGLSKIPGKYLSGLQDFSKISKIIDGLSH